MEDFVCKRISAQVSIKSTSGLIFLCVKVAACKASVCKRVPCAETARARARVCTSFCLHKTAFAFKRCQEPDMPGAGGISRFRLLKRRAGQEECQRKTGTTRCQDSELSGERVARERDANGKLDQEIWRNQNRGWRKRRPGKDGERDATGHEMSRKLRQRTPLGSRWLRCVPIGPFPYYRFPKSSKLSPPGLPGLWFPSSEW